MKMLKGGPIGAVGTVRSFMNVVKDIDFEETRHRAEQVPTILVLATNDELADDAATQLFGTNDRKGVTSRSWANAQSDFDPSRYDLVIVYDPKGDNLFEKIRSAAKAHKDSGNVFFLSARIDDSRAHVKSIRREIMEALPEMAPSFGRHHESWRGEAVHAIVDQTSRANAQFALVSNIPAVIPLLGGLVSASADLLVLTKNQLMMCYKIAAAHGQDLDDHMAIIRELTPVVGAGFVWRTAAREAAAFVPFAAGTIPKVAIAFGGTMTMGKAADYFYQYGSKPGRAQLGRFKDQAQELLAKLPFAEGLGEETRREARERFIDGPPAKVIQASEFGKKSQGS